MDCLGDLFYTDKVTNEAKRQLLWKELCTADSFKLVTAHCYHSRIDPDVDGSTCPTGRNFSLTYTVALSQQFVLAVKYLRVDPLFPTEIDKIKFFGKLRNRFIAWFHGPRRGQAYVQELRNQRLLALAQRNLQALAGS